MAARLAPETVMRFVAALVSALLSVTVLAPPAEAASTVIEAEQRRGPLRPVPGWGRMRARAADGTWCTGRKRGLDDGHDAVCDAARLACQGAPVPGGPRAVVKVDGETVLVADVTATAWTDYGAPVTIAAGDHEVSVQFPNDLLMRVQLWLSPGCGRLRRGRRGRPPGTTGGRAATGAARCRSQTKRESRGRSAIASTAGNVSRDEWQQTPSVRISRG